MPCFCATPAARLPMMAPQARLAVSAVPPQLEQLAELLGMENAAAAGAVRADAAMDAALPNTTAAAWMKATFTAAVPDARLPAVLPASGGPLVAVVMRLAVAKAAFPLTEPRRLMAELQQAVRSLKAQVMRQLAAVRAVPHAPLQNMALAARLTLALRKQGLCPMALARVDASFSEAGALGDPALRLRAAATFAASIKGQPVPPLALPAAKLDLAAKMAAFAPLATAHEALGLPPASEPEFAQAALAAVTDLARIPAMPAEVAELLDAAAKLDALATITEAFGADAMTPAGVARVNAMLSYVARLRIALPPELMAVQSQVAALPPLEDVRKGAMAAKQAAPSFVASMSAKVPDVAVLPLLEAMSALHAVMHKALGESPFGPCDACQFPLAAS